MKGAPPPVPPLLPPPHDTKQMRTSDTSTCIRKDRFICRPPDARYLNVCVLEISDYSGKASSLRCTAKMSIYIFTFTVKEQKDQEIKGLNPYRQHIVNDKEK